MAEETATQIIHENLKVTTNLGKKIVLLAMVTSSHKNQFYTVPSINDNLTH